MLDPILAGRLAALEESLAGIAATRGLQAKLREAHVVIRPEVWQGLERTIGGKAREQREAIEKIRRRFQGTGDDQLQLASLADAWSDYSRLSQQSQELFREFLEFLGGLAYRSRELDERICRIADALILSCSGETIGDQWQSMTVPAPQEVVNKTLAALVRLRFPERAIWTLPFAAHEFGHEVIGENGLRDFVDEQVKGWLRSRAPSMRGRRMTRRKVEFYLNELFADAFATYYMGPCYACAAIHLRFDPSINEDDEHPSDLKRAHVILTMLGYMNEAAIDRPYSDLLRRLQSSWDAICRHVAMPRLDATETTRIEQLTRAAYRKFSNFFIASALYPTGGDSGWLVANEWRERWDAEVHDGQQELSIPQISEASSLRDVLNAAWLFRVYQDDVNAVNAVHNVALRFCEEIADEQQIPALIVRLVADASEAASA
jgi:hypothetical protein